MIAGERDLVGFPAIQRSADFVHGDRIRLSRDWGPGPRAFVLGHNPARADGDTDDMTALWLIAWFQLFGFGGFDLGNLYPFVTADPAECRRRANWSAANDWHARDQMQFVNLPAIVEMAQKADQIFVCFGAIAQDWDWVEHVVEQIQSEVDPTPDLWCWGKAKAGAPKHPMARGVHRIPRDQKPILWRAA